MDYTLTNNGAVLMTQVAAGRTILFTRVESGSGYTASPAGLQSVIDKKQDMFLDEVLFENRQATIKTVLSNMQLEEGYQLRQVGVYAKLEGDEADTLVIIGQQYNGEKIPPYGEGIIQIEYDITMKVSGTGNVTIEGVGTGYVTKGQFQAHLNDHSNPHQVTKKQIGLELVPNVGTDDQTPTFEEAEERENIVSEEKVSVIFGKVRKWFSDLKGAAFCSVANNMETTLPGSVMDARVGPEIKAQITGLYSDITAPGDTVFVFDYQNGKYGYNLSPTRGADTFVPFSDEEAFRLALYNAIKPSGFVTANMTHAQMCAALAKIYGVPPLIIKVQITNTSGSNSVNTTTVTVYVNGTVSYSRSYIASQLINGKYVDIEGLIRLSAPHNNTITALRDIKRSSNINFSSFVKMNTGTSFEWPYNSSEIWYYCAA